MSQEQLRRPQPVEPIKYGDVFNVDGDLASQPIAPRDAAAMQSKENLALGDTQRSGPAAVMQSAAWLNERAGLVNHNDAKINSDNIGVYKFQRDGNILITEELAGQVVAQYVKPDVPAKSATAAIDGDAVTIGEALEAAALSEGNKPVEHSDAAAIQAAEMRATQKNTIQPGGVAAAAQSAATQNERAMNDALKTKLGDVLSDAAQKLPADKAVTPVDAQGVIAAEMRNKPDMRSTTGGVGAAMAAAAMMNQKKTVV